MEVDNRGSGGGYLNLQSEGELSLMGDVRADGDNGYSNDELGVFNGAGGGGAILLSAANITGSGSVSARGGNSDDHGYSGEGGGGIIQITVYDLISSTAYFTGSMNVQHGNRWIDKYNDEGT